MAYIPRAQLERNVVSIFMLKILHILCLCNTYLQEFDFQVSGIYQAIVRVYDIEMCVDEPDKVKTKCLGLRQFLDSILERNKVRRPSRPTTSGIQIQQHQPPTMEDEHAKEIPIQEHDSQPVNTQWTQV